MQLTYTLAAIVTFSLAYYSAIATACMVTDYFSMVVSDIGQMERHVVQYLRHTRLITRHTSSSVFDIRLNIR